MSYLKAGKTDEATLSALKKAGITQEQLREKLQKTRKKYLSDFYDQVTGKSGGFPAKKPAVAKKVSTRIKELGGVNRKSLVEHGLEPEEIAKMPVGVITKDGRDLGVHASTLFGEGEISEDSADYLAQLLKNKASLLSEEQGKVETMDKKWTAESNKDKKLDEIKDLKKKLRSAPAQTREQIKEFQTQITNFIKSLPIDANDKAKFIDTIKRANTKKSLERELENINRRAKQYYNARAKRGLQAKIDREMKYTKPIKSGDRKVGRYDYESNKFFDEVRSVFKLTQAKAQMALDSMPTEGLSQIDLIKARILSLKANGMSATVELYKQVLEDIRRMKRLGTEAKDDADFQNSLERHEQTDDLLSRIDKQKTFPLEEGYLRGFSDVGSLFNAIAGKEFSDTNNPRLIQNNVFTKQYYHDIEDNAKIAQIYGLDSPEKAHEYIVTNLLPKQYKIVDLIDGLETDISKGDLFQIYNGIKNDMIRERYYNAFGETQITELIENLSDKDMDVADYLMERVQEMKDIFNADAIRRTGRDMGTVDEYWPSASERVVNTSDDMRIQGQTPSAERDRVQSTKVVPKVVNGFTTYQKHIADALHTEGLSQKYEDLKRLFTDRVVKDRIIKKFGDKVYNLVLTKIDDIALNRALDRIDAISGAYNFILNNWVSAKIASPSVFLTQLGSVINFAENILQASGRQGLHKHW